MDDLRRILAGRAAFYSKADASFDTSGRSEAESFPGLLALVVELLARRQRDAADEARAVRRHEANCSSGLTMLARYAL